VTGLRSISVGPLLLLSLAALNCGSSRHLQSVSLQPAQATANNAPVQFAATGTFTKPPSPQPLTSKDVRWCASQAQGGCPGNINPGATVDQNGLAQCLPGWVGTAYIMAGSGLTATSMNPDAGSQFKVFGSAKLTCP
jgi:hypothetical protein